MNETYGHRAHLASIWQGVGKVLARCWQGHELAKCLRSACHHYGKSMGRVWLRQLKVESLKLKVSLYSSRDKMSIERVGGIQGEFTQNSRGIQAEFKENSGRIPVDGSEMVRRWLEDGPSTSSGTSKMKGSASQYDGFELPVRRERTASTSGANCQYVGLVLRSIRYAACLILMMVVGVSGVKAQTDYSGVYYIASMGKYNTNKNFISYNSSDPSNNYYLCPTEGWCYYKPDNDFSNDGTTYPNPFLTTFKCKTANYHTGNSADAVWQITKDPNSDHYFIKHLNSGRYLLSNGQIRTSTNADRMRVHLGYVADPNNPGDPALFDVTPISNTSNVTISIVWSHGVNNTHKWLTVNNGSYDNLVGNSGKNGGPNDSNIGNYSNVAGIVCIYTEDDVNAPFYLEKASVDPPTITNNFDGTITITAETGATIYYTTSDGSQADPTTLTPTTGTTSVTITLGSNETNIKAIAKGASDYFPSLKSEYNLPQYTAPTISFNSATSQVTINPGSGGTAYYNTGDGSQADPTTSSTAYSAPFTVSSATTVKAIATHAGYIASTVAELAIAQVATPTIQDNGNDAFSITCATDGATIYYRTSTDGGSTYGSYTAYNGTPLTGLASGTYIKAYATKTGLINSAECEPFIVRQACVAPTINVTYNNDGTATVSITNNDTNGASVYYTTDGSTPTSGSSPYSAPFDVTSGMTVKAVAVNTGYNNSNPAEETVVQVATPVIAIVNNEITITCGTEGATIYYKVDDGDFTAYTSALGLSANVSGHTITAYATKSSMVKSANAVATASETKLTLPTPTITPGENGAVTFSIDPTITGVTYKYTLDGTAPTNETTSSTESAITLGSPAIVKVIAIHPNYVTSGVASSTSYVIPTNIPLLIQSQNNPWNTTDFHFYMIPGDEDNSIIKVNTTSLFRPSMEWHFESAGLEDGVQFYYIVNNSAKDNENNPYYLCWDGTNVCMLIYDSNNANKFKFKIVESATAGSFNIIPYAQRNTSGNTNRFVYKPNDGNNICNANAKALSLSNTNNANSQWKFVQPSTLDKTAPFTVSNATNGTVYYKLSTEATPTAYVTPATTPTGYVTTAASASTHQDWYIEQVNTTTTDDDWLTYYYIRNATTNEYLYYNESATNTNAFEMRSRIESDADCYQFTVARATIQDRWFIVPKKKIGTTLNNIWTIYRDNNNALKLQATRNNSSTMWQFTNSTLTLAPPVVEFDPVDGKFKLSCSTDNVTYRYTTGDGTQADPTADSGTEYTANGIEPGAFTEIKAVAIKNSTASDVTTYHAAVLPTSTTADHPYRIQNVDCSYFYLQSREAGNVKTNTSSLARPNSAWRLEDAGHRGGTQLYRVYLKESETNNSYLYYNSSTNVCMKSQTEYDANPNDFGFLFYLSPYYDGGTTLDGYYVIPSNDATVRSLSKNTSSGNNNEGDVFAQNISSADYKMARWNFIPQADWGLPETIPTSVLQVSDDNATYYYKIRNYNDTDYYIIPPTGTTGNAAYVGTSNANTDNNNMAWVFRIADQDAWLNYYHIRNALTGEYLYFNGDPTVTNNNTAFITKDKPAASASDTEKDRYQFIIAKTTDTANDGTGPYYIVPKPLKDLAQQSFNSLYRDGGNPLKTKADRSNNKIKWTFEFIETLFCMPPKIMLDEEGHIDIVATTNASTVYYKQDDATDYSTYSSLLQMSEGSKTTITAKATLFPGQATEYPSSEIEKIVIYQPTITLSQESYSYDGLAHTPTVSRVMLGEEDITDKCIVTYENNVTPGTATVIISSNDDDYVIYGSTTFTIESVGLIVAVDNITKEYGDADPVLTYTPTGLGVGDELTVNIERETGEGIGSYGISFVKVGTTDNVDYTLQRSGQDVSGDYSSITFKDGILYIVPKNIGDGIVPAEGISINLTKEGTATEYSPTLTHLKAGYTDPTSLVLNTDFTVGEPTVVRDDKIWTAKGKGRYTNAAQVAYITPPFIQNQGVTPEEYIAGYMATVDWSPITTGTNTWILTSVNPTVNIVTAVPVAYLPKDVPVLLTAASNLERIIVSPKSHAVASISNADRNRNLLKRVPKGGLSVQPAQVYVFYNKAEVGTGEFVLALGGTLSEGCYYIENPNYSPTGTTSGAPRRLKIQWGEATGIEDVEWIMDNVKPDTWYTIDGRKLNGKPQERGLYINGGKKMMVK